MSLRSLLAEGCVWLQRCGSQRGHPDCAVKGHPEFLVKGHPDFLVKGLPVFVVKAEKAVGSAQQSHQQAGAGKRRSDQAIPAN